MARTQQTDDKAQAAGRAAVGRTTQSENSLARAAGQAPEDGRFSISEEVNFDEQSDQARRVGQMPDDVPAAGAAANASGEDAAAPDQEARTKLKQSMDRASPPPPLR